MEKIWQVTAVVQHRIGARSQLPKTSSGVGLTANINKNSTILSGTTPKCCGGAQSKLDVVLQRGTWAMERLVICKCVGTRNLETAVPINQIIWRGCWLILLGAKENLSTVEEAIRITLYSNFFFLRYRGSRVVVKTFEDIL